MKKTLLSLVAVVAALFVFTSCSSPEKMKTNASQVATQCVPQVLEIKNNAIEARWTATFPAGYFHKKAILKLQPVLVYQGGEVAGPVKMLQGEKVTNNYEVVTAMGGAVSQNVKFDYKPGMEKSRLELRATLIHKEKEIPFDKPYHLADGAIATYKLLSATGVPAYTGNNYQPYLTKTQESEIKYVVNRSDVRKTELSKADVQALKQFIADAETNPKMKYEGLDVSSYASPEGRYNVNEKLSLERGKTSQDAMNELLKKDKKDKNNYLGTVTAKNTAEDWDGFRELVAASDMQDKDLILRVLSMYSDPNTREQEIRNMSKAFKVLEDKILPELRRAVMVAKVRVNNHSDEELKGMVSSNNTGSLDVESLLYAATLYNDNATKAKLYKQAADKYADDRAYTNLAATNLAQGNLAGAKQAYNSIKDKSTAQAKNVAALIAVGDGKYDDASKLFSEVSSLPQAKQNAGIVAIEKGNYDAAAAALAGTNTYNEALALVLTNKLDAADKILSNQSDAASSYLRAVVAARKGNSSNVSTYLKDAFAKDPSLKAKAQNDIEFAKFPNAIQ